MADAPLWITEAEVTALLSLPEAIDALERTLFMETAGQAASMPKAHLMVAGNDAMHAIGGAVSGAGICGTKTWVNLQGKSQTVLILFSLVDGGLRAIVEATALGQMRTAAMTGVGTRRLAREGADVLAVIGSGKQALPNVAACAAVRKLRQVRVFSRRPEAREGFAEQAHQTLDLDVRASTSLEEAVDGASIVTLITNATAPFLTPAMVVAGTHINAMGAIVPARIEFTQGVFDRCAMVVVDTIVGVRNLSAEFRERYGEDDAAWSDVLPISKVLADGLVRPEGCDLTLFKAMGMGISDLALGIEILARAEAQGRGTTLPERVRAPPRLR